MRDLDEISVCLIAGGDPGLVIVPPPTYPNFPNAPWDGTFPADPVIPPPDVGSIKP